jgi:cytochrome c biogenesis protein CcdA
MDDKIVSFYLERIQNGEIEFDQIRKDLELKNFSNESITKIIRKVDEELLLKVTANHKVATSKALMIFGGTLTIFGFIFTISSFLGLFQTNTQQIIVIAYGPFFSGLFILLALRGKNQKRNLFKKKKSFFNKINTGLN